jgi:hypothetical protein
MTYKEETKHWIDDLFTALADEGLNVEAGKYAILERILQSFKNGVKAGRKGKSESKNSQAPSDLPIVPQA